MKTALLWIAASAFAQTTVDRGVVYLTPRSQAPAMKMDIAKPGGQGPFPVVLLVHGGGFTGGSPESMRPMAERLAKEGWASAAVTYRLAPRFQFPAPLQDLKAAVRFLRANGSRWNLRTERVCAMGEEAGGTLALLLGMTRGISKYEGRSEYGEHASAVDCAVNVNGPVDLAALPLLQGVAPLLGGGVAASRAAYAEASPVSWVTPASAAILSIVPHRVPQGAGAQMLAQRLGEAGVEGRFVPGDPPGWAEWAVPFLRRHLTPPRDRFTVLAADHGPGAELIALGWPSGRVLWKVPNGTGLDVQALPNGHVLFTNHQAKRVVEIDRNQKEVWSLGPEAGLVTPFSVRRLSNGNTLVGDAAGARVTEFTPDGKAAWKWEKPDMADAWPRMSRRTAAGTTLVAFQKGGVVFEIDREGKTVWEFRIDPARLPYQAVRLGNGNTLIGLVDPGEVIEVDPAGKILRRIGGGTGPLRFGWIAGFDPLPDGGLLIADFTGKRIVETNAAGIPVHELRDLPWAIASVAAAAAPE